VTCVVWTLRCSIEQGRLAGLGNVSGGPRRSEKGLGPPISVYRTSVEGKLIEARALLSSFMQNRDQPQESAQPLKGILEKTHRQLSAEIAARGGAVKAANKQLVARQPTQSSQLTRQPVRGSLIPVVSHHRRFDFPEENQDTWFGCRLLITPELSTPNQRSLEGLLCRLGWIFGMPAFHVPAQPSDRIAEAGQRWGSAGTTIVRGGSPQPGRWLGGAAWMPEARPWPCLLRTATAYATAYVPTTPGCLKQSFDSDSMAAPTSWK